MGTTLPWALKPNPFSLKVASVTASATLLPAALLQSTDNALRLASHAAAPAGGLRATLVAKQRDVSVALGAKGRR